MLNEHLLVTSAEHYSDEVSLNPYCASTGIDRTKAQREHAQIVALFERAGITITQIPAPSACQDGMYVANWALVNDGVAVLSRLPSVRADEEPYAAHALTELGLHCIRVPEGLLFSGQGDALACGRYLFAGQTYRSDIAAQVFAAQALGLTVVLLETVPLIRNGKVCVNRATCRPDSLFYDLDLALAVIDEQTIAYVPQAFTAPSRRQLDELPLERIIVDYDEATKGFACNLVSTGQSVILSAHAPQLQAELEGRGLTILPVDATEIQKGGGFIRCISLSLS